MKPKSKKGANASREESLISFWWKLKVNERRSHFETIKVDLLSPILFYGSYTDKFCLRWAKDIAIRSYNRTEVLLDETYGKVDLFEDAVGVLQENLSKFEGKKYLDGMIQSMEGIRKEYKGTQDVPSATTTLKGIGQQDWFKHFRSAMTDSRVFDKQFRDTTLLISSMKVFIYIESLKHGEFPLEVYHQKTVITDGKALLDKERANRLFADRMYEKAITLYDSILELKPYCHIIYSNRAQCFLSLGRYRHSLADARRAIALNPSSEKGQYRFCRSLELLGKQDDAARAAKRALKACPSSTDLEKLQKRIRQKLDTSQVARRLDLILKSDEPPELVTPSGGDQSSDTSCFDDQDSDSSDYDDVGEADYSSEASILGSDSDDQCDDQSYGSVEGNSDGPKKARKLTKRLPAVPGTRVRSKATHSIKESSMPNLQVEMKKGTKYFMAKNYDCASTYFNLVLNLSKSKKNLSLPKDEAVVLTYAYGMCSFESGSDEDMVAAKKQFDLIIENFSDVNFPLAHYGCGQIFHKQSKFPEMQLVLHQALDIITKSGVVLRRWPGSDFVIEETKPGKLEHLINHLLDSAVGAVRLPDAICRFNSCDLNRNIFKDDLDFKGFIQLKCNEACKIEYHSVCWQKVKKKLNFKDQSPLKDFLNRKCLTPDCCGILYIMNYTFVNREGEIKSKEHKVDLPKKPITATPKIDKSKRMKACSHKKLLKKSALEEEKEIKREKERLKEMDDDITNILNELDEEEKMCRHISEMTVDEGNAKSDNWDLDWLPVYNSRNNYSYRDAAMYTLKKEDEPASVPGKQGTKKRKKKSKKNKGTQGLTTFIGEEETNSLREVLNEVRSIDRSTSLSSSATSSNFDLSLDFQSDHSKAVAREHLLSIFADLLVSKGGMNVETDADVMELLSILDIHSSRLINSCGGLRFFLASSPKFAFDPDNPNIVYLAEEAEIYLFSKREAAKRKMNGFYKDNDSRFTHKPFNGQTKNGSSKTASVMSTDPAIISLSMDSAKPTKSPGKINKRAQGHSTKDASSLNGKGGTIVHCVSNFGGVVVDNHVAPKPRDSASSNQKNDVGSSQKEDKRSGLNGKQFLEQLRNEMIRKSDQLEAEQVIEVSRIAAERKDVAVMTENGLNNMVGGKEDVDDEAMHELYARALDNCEQFKNKLKVVKEAASVKETELKREIENLKSKLMKEQQSRESAQKKWQHEKEKLTGTIKSLYEKISSFDEDGYKVKLLDKEREVEKMTVKVGELRLQNEQSTADNQDIIDKLSTCVTEQSIRAQKAEVLFMGMKKSEVSNDFKRRLESIQWNVYMIENNPFLEQASNRQEMLKNWIKHRDVVSKNLRTQLTKLDERIQLIKDGTPLDEIPPLHVPPLPLSPPQPKMMPFPGNLPAQNPMQMPGFPFENFSIPPMAVPHNAANQPINGTAGDPRAASPNDASERTPTPTLNSNPNASSLQATAVPTSLACAAEASNGNADQSSTKNAPSPLPEEVKGAAAMPTERKEEKASKTKASEKGSSKSTSFEKIMSKLCSQFPTIQRDDFITYLKQFREKRNNTLHGLQVEEIIAGVTKMIKKERLHGENDDHSLKSAKGKSKIKGKAFGFEEPCIICHDDMLSVKETTRLGCYHVFHTECIRRWLKEQRTCPTCRNHALLPSEYPSLK